MPESAREISGVRVSQRRVIADQRGAVLHFLRSDDEEFAGFGEVYFSEIQPGAVKAWKRHARITQRFVVPVGHVRFVLVDRRPGSPTSGVVSEFVLGRPESYMLLMIPPGVWYGFSAVGSEPGLVANITDAPHDPAEADSVAPDHVDFPTL